MRSLALLTVLALASPAWADGDETARAVLPEGNDRAALFAYVDGLGYPATHDLEVVTLRRWGDDVIAFVIERDGSRFDVLTAELARIRGEENTGPDLIPHERVELLPADLVTAARAQLRAHLEEPPTWNRWAPQWVELPPRTELVVLARSLSARKVAPDLETELLDLACRMPGAVEWPEDRQDEPLVKMVRKDMELHLRRVAFLYGSWNPDYAPAEHRARFEHYLEHFPKGDVDYPHAKWAESSRAHIVVLDRMIAEEPTVPSEAALQDLQGDALIAALIRRLRYQTPQGPGAMGGPGMYFGLGGDTPADRLLAIGRDALPQLIDAMHDDTLTRITSAGRVGITPGIVRVGDVAIALVRELTGQHFASPELGHAWLARLRTEGELPLLLEDVRQGGWSGMERAKELIERFPESAFEPLHELLVEETTARHERCSALELLATLDDERVDDLLRSTLTTEHTLIRVAAARALHARGEQALSDVLLTIWRSSPGPALARSRMPPGAWSRLEDEHTGWEQLIAFLVAHGDDAVLATLHEGLAERPPFVRYWVCRDVATSGRGVLHVASSKRSLTAAERIVRDGLLDEGLGAEHASMSVGDNGREPIQDRVAERLATRFPDRFAFRQHAAPWVREAYRARMLNALAALSGEAQRPEAPLPTFEPLDADDVSPLVDALLAATDDEAQQAAEDALARAGIAAIPAVRALRADRTTSPELERGYARAFRRLTLTIREVVVHEGLPEAATEPLRALGDLRGKPLDAAALQAAVQGVAGVTDAQGLQIELYYPANDTGCSIVVGPAGPRGRQRFDLNGFASQSGGKDLPQMMGRYCEDVLEVFARRPEYPMSSRLRIWP